MKSSRTPSSAARKRPRVKPKWERGYRSHGLWRGNEKLGSVRLAGNNDPVARYEWQAGTRMGRAVSLREAKRAVEGVVLVGASQLTLPLFAGNEASENA